MSRILVVFHSQGGNTEALAAAVKEGAQSVEGVQAEVKRAFDADADDLLSCDGVAFGTPDFFGYMAGGLKDFFDRVYYAVLKKVDEKPYVAFVSHGGGGKAIDSVEAICNSCRLKKVAEPLIAKGKPTSESLEKAKELGRALAQAVKA